MIDDIYDHTVREYMATLKSLFEVRPSEEELLLVTPFQRLDGDYIEVAIVPESRGKFTMTDRGDSLNFLFVSGLDIENQEFRSTVSMITSQNGTEMSGDEILTTATAAKLGEALHALINSTVAVSHLAFRERPAKVPGL